MCCIVDAGGEAILGEGTVDILRGLRLALFVLIFAGACAPVAA
jgi:hypothetical protein